MIYQEGKGSYQLSVAPMLDVTDRHCRYFHRLLAPNALLYTEMVTTGALIYGDQKRHLQFNLSEHPVALQLGGSDAEDLVQCAKIAQSWGYDEINLNCGCPSARVQKGAFGAVLMQDPLHVAHLWERMQSVVDIPVTIKHRMGIGYEMNFDFVYRFVEVLYQKGCRVFISHARNAILEGLSPKENRQIPPLHYDWVSRLKRDFNEARFVINGGIQEVAQVDYFLTEEHLDGVMVGRVAWHEPYRLREMSKHIWGDESHLSLEEIVWAMQDYAKIQIQEGVPLRLITKPMLGLFNGLPGSRGFRRTLSDCELLKQQSLDVFEKAYDCLRGNISE